MLPIDAVQLPLKTAEFQLQNAIQRVKALLKLKEEGKLTQEQVDKVKENIQDEANARQKTYASLGKILTAVENFVPEKDTQLLSQSGNTPLQYDVSLQITQSNEMNRMLRDVAVAEYVARNFTDEKTVQEATENTNGIDFSACYKPLHDAIHDMRFQHKANKLTFLAKQLFAEKPQKLEEYQKLLLSCGEEITQVVPQNLSPDLDIDVDAYLQLNPDNVQKQVNCSCGRELHIPQSKIDLLCAYMKDQYVQTFCNSPYFPEKLMGRGYQVFTTQFCNQAEPHFVNYDGYYCACPGCLRPQGLDFKQNRALKSTIRCAVTKRLIDLDNTKYYYLKDVGFLSEEGKAQHPNGANAQRVILCW